MLTQSTDIAPRNTHGCVSEHPSHVSGLTARHAVTTTDLLGTVRTLMLSYPRAIMSTP